MNETSAQKNRTELLVELFMHFDRMMWQAPLHYLSAAALVMGAGAWSAANLEAALPGLGLHPEALFGASAVFAGLLLLVGANHMSNSRRHRGLVRDELRTASDIAYFTAAKGFKRVSAPMLAIVLLTLTALVMIAGGAVLASGLRW